MILIYIICVISRSKFTSAELIYFFSVSDRTVNFKALIPPPMEKTDFGGPLQITGRSGYYGGVCSNIGTQKMLTNKYCFKNKYLPINKTAENFYNTDEKN